MRASGTRRRLGPPHFALRRLTCRSGADRQRARQLFQSGDDRERRQPAGARVFGRRHVLDLHRQAGGFGLDLDAVNVAVTVGSAQISIVVRSGPIPARASAAATLTFAGKPRAASRAVPRKDAFGLGQSGNADAVLFEIGRARKAAAASA